jgi:hypothetical protein
MFVAKFVQSEEFIAARGGRLGDISIYGQESNYTTWRLAKMTVSSGTKQDSEFAPKGRSPGIASTALPPAESTGKSSTVAVALQKSSSIVAAWPGIALKF